MKMHVVRPQVGFPGRSSLHIRHLEVVGVRKKGRVRETRESPSRAPVLSCAYYFQAPATQARSKSHYFLPITRYHLGLYIKNIILLYKGKTEIWSLQSSSMQVQVRIRLRMKSFNKNASNHFFSESKNCVQF